MANTNSPNGFQPVGAIEGNANTAGFPERRIASNNGTAIYRGDPVVSLGTGYIAQATAGTTQIAGIFWGCKYTSVSQKKTLWMPYWPGSDATGDVIAQVITNPNALFRVRAGGAAVAIGFADIDANANFGLGTGNAANGMSGAYLDQTTLGATATLPFKIVDIVRDPPGMDGTDITSAYNLVLVKFNFADMNSATGIV